MWPLNLYNPLYLVRQISPLYLVRQIFHQLNGKAWLAGLIVKQRWKLTPLQNGLQYITCRRRISNLHR